MKETGYIIILLILGAIFEFSMRATLSRNLSVDDYGIFSYVVNLYLVLGAISTLGFINILPKYLPIYMKKSDDKVKETISLSFLYCSMSSVISVIILIVILYFSTLVRKESIIYIVPLIPLYVLSELIFSTNRSFSKIKTALIQRDILRRGVPFFLMLAYIYIYRGDLNINVAIVTVMIGIFSAIIYGGHEYFKNLYKKPSRRIKLNIHKYGLPIFLSLILSQLNARMDLLIGGVTIENNSLGLYSGALILSQTIVMIGSIVIIPLMPKLSKLFHEKNLEEIKKIHLNKSAILIILGILPVGLFTINGEFWLTTILGNNYSLSTNYLILLSISNFLMLIGALNGVTILSSGASKLFLLTDLASFIIGATAQFVLSYFYSATGLAVGSIIMALTIITLRTIITSRLISLKLNDISVKYVVMLALLIATIFLVNLFKKEGSSIIHSITWVTLYSFFIYTYIYRFIGFSNISKLMKI